MRLATRAQAQEIDLLSEKVFHLSGEILMESAGLVSAREVDQTFYPDLKKGKIALICGPGNNGGDGLVMARHLFALGHRDLDLYLLAPAAQRSELFSKQLKRVEVGGFRLIDLEREPEKIDQIRSAGFIVDALFGTGLTRPLTGDYLRIVEVINSSQVNVVSLDTPSGIDCDAGVIMGVAVKATMTITFGLAKPGFFLGDGPRCCGRLRVVPIGFPYEVQRGVATSHFGFNERLVHRYLPKRSDKSNKSDCGRVLVAAGHEGMWGAAILAATSAYRMGAGYVTVASFEDPSPVLLEVPEVLTARLSQDFLKQQKWSSLVVGPGLGVSKECADFIALLKEDQEHVVLDADALTVCVQFGLFPLPESWVVTPHSGELSRILKISANEIEADRCRFALQGAHQVGCHLLLKGFHSVLAFEKRCMIIMAGNSALAKAGTGDVLAGMIGGLLAQGLPTLQATATAAYIHGRMADEWVRVGHGRASLCASDLREHLPVLMGRLGRGALF